MISKIFNKKQFFHQDISELSIYALEESHLQKIVERAIQNILTNIDIDYCLIFDVNPEKTLFRLLGSNIESYNNSSNIMSVNNIWDTGIAFNSPDSIWSNDYKKEYKLSLIPILHGYGIRSGLLMKTGTYPSHNGILCLYSRTPASFTKPEINYLRNISRIVGASVDRNKAAIMNSQLNQELDSEIKNNQRFQREILNNSIVERWKLGEYLHDNFAQTLASIKITINELKKEDLQADKQRVAQELETIKNLIDKQIDDIRNLSHEIIPIDVEEEGVSYAFRLLLKQTQRTYKVKCTLVADNIINRINDRELSTNLYHITQEAIKNAINHGKAKNIQVTMKSRDTNLLLKIQDDGIGISQEDKKSGGMGLRIIQHRVELFGGKFSINHLSRKTGFNTSIECTIPFETINEPDKE